MDCAGTLGRQVSSVRCLAAGRDAGQGKRHVASSRQQHIRPTCSWPHKRCIAAAEVQGARITGCQAEAARLRPYMLRLLQHVSFDTLQAQVSTLLLKGLVLPGSLTAFGHASSVPGCA